MTGTVADSRRGQRTGTRPTELLNGLMAHGQEAGRPARLARHQRRGGRERAGLCAPSPRRPAAGRGQPILLRSERPRRRLDAESHGPRPHGANRATWSRHAGPFEPRLVTGTLTTEGVVRGDRAGSVDTFGFVNVGLSGGEPRVQRDRARCPRRKEPRHRAATRSFQDGRAGNPGGPFGVRLLSSGRPAGVAPGLHRCSSAPRTFSRNRGRGGYHHRRPDRLQSSTSFTIEYTAAGNRRAATSPGPAGRCLRAGQYDKTFTVTTTQGTPGSRATDRATGRCETRPGGASLRFFARARRRHCPSSTTRGRSCSSAADRTR